MSKYNYRSSPGSTYERALKLLAPYLKESPEPGIILDLACGNGPIAEGVFDELSVTYVGVDSDERAIKGLQSRGFEAHIQYLTDGPAEVGSALARIIGDRRVSAITILDGLEHLPQFRSVLDVISSLSREHNAPVVISTPNITHKDVGFKLAAGSWDYTHTGLLDATHVHFFTEATLADELAAVGLAKVAESNIFREVSDQAFPSDHPYLLKTTSINRVLNFARAGDKNRELYQLVWLCGPSLKSAVTLDPAILVPESPFATVIMRTQGKRLHQLRETLLCLGAQSSDDFEVIVLGHSMTEGAAAKVDELIREFPPAFAQRIHLQKVDGGTRSRPLNVGLATARGQYITVLDDDDYVFANWIEEFERLAQMSPGSVLRSQSAVQWFDAETGGGREFTSASSGMTRPYERRFSLVSHALQNQSPFMTLAFPRSVRDILHFEFDEALTTYEDWDFLLRSAGILGVANSDVVTAVYRKWNNIPSSDRLSELEWSENRTRVLEKLDAGVAILPRGEISYLAQILGNQLVPIDSRREYEDSRSWKITAPLRRATNVLRRVRSKLRRML